jgi:MoxR-like ATPase
MPRKPFETVAMLQAALRGGGYLASDGLSVSLFLALAKSRPLFLEGEAGVGKTEIAKMLARLLGRDLIRLQCYEGLDIAQAAYEWNYAQQLVEIHRLPITCSPKNSSLNDRFSKPCRRIPPARQFC